MKSSTSKKKRSIVSVDLLVLSWGFLGKSLCYDVYFYRNLRLYWCLGRNLLAEFRFGQLILHIFYRNISKNNAEHLHNWTWFIYTILPENRSIINIYGTPFSFFWQRIEEILRILYQLFFVIYGEVYAIILACVLIVRLIVVSIKASVDWFEKLSRIGGTTWWKEIILYVHGYTVEMIRLNNLWISLGTLTPFIKRTSICLLFLSLWGLLPSSISNRPISFRGLWFLQINFYLLLE